MAMTCPEGVIAGRTVRRQEPKNREAGLGGVAESRPWAMNQPGCGDGKHPICGGWR